VKKLLLIPTVVLTAFLALAFLMPATAAHVIRSVAPVAQISLAFGNSAANENAGAAPASNAGTAGSVALSAGSSSSRVSSPPGSSTSSADSTAQLLISSQTGHEVATGGETNCGRFGNGHHGGKHDFICKNTPFPQAPNP
jgi:hypothetical protein